MGDTAWPATTAIVPTARLADFSLQDLPDVTLPNSSVSFRRDSAPGSPLTPATDIGLATMSSDQPGSPARRRGWLRVLAGVLGGVLLAAYVGLGLSYLAVRHVVWSDLARWQPQIESLISQRVGLPVRLEGLAGHFEGFSPGLVAERFSIGAADQVPVLSVSDLELVLSWRTLWHWRFDIDVLQARELSVSVAREDDRRFRVANLPFELPQADPRHRSAPLQPWQLPDWLLGPQSIRLADVTIDYSDGDHGERVRATGVSIRSSGEVDERSVVIDFPGIGGLAGPGSIQARLERRPRANSAPSVASAAPGPSAWQGEAHARLDTVDLPVLAALLRLPSPLASGKLGAQAWFSVIDSRPANLRVDLAGGPWHFDSSNGSTQWLSTVGATVDGQWQNNGDLALTLHDASLIDQTGNQVALGTNSQSLTLRPDLSLAKADLSVQATDAARALAVARSLPFLPDLRDRYAGLALNGRIDRLGFVLDAQADGPASFSVDARFSRLDVAFGPERQLSQPLQSFDPRLPWGEKLSGALVMNERGGSLRLEGAMPDGQTALGFPGIFAEPRIALDELAADIEWRRLSVADGVNQSPPANPGVQVEVRHLLMANQDARAEVAGRWSSVGQSHRGVSDIRCQLSRADLTRVHRYLPLEIKRDVRRWMREAFVAGRSDDIQAVLRGDLARFPFVDPADGEFSIVADIDSGRFGFLPEYPPFTDIQGKVELTRGGLSGRIHSARIFESAVRSASFGIPDLRDPVLDFKLAVDGPSQELVRYVNESPVHRFTDDFLRRAQISGRAFTELGMSLHLRGEPTLQLSGLTRLDGVDARLTDYLPPMSDVRGVVNFGTDGLVIHDLSLSMLGGRAAITATTPERGRTDLRIKGVASAAGLRAENDTPITRSLEGRTEYEATIGASDQGVRMDIRSTLAGMAIQLPDPMRKSVHETWPMSLSLRPTRDTSTPGRRSDRLALSIGDRLQAVFERQTDAGGRQRIQRGVVAAGAPPELPAQGFALALDTPKLNADAWARALEIHGSADADRPAGNRADTGYFAGFDRVPTQVRLVTGSLVQAHKTFNNVVLGATREGRDWNVNLSARELNGHLQWLGAERDTDVRVVGRFTRLEIPADQLAEFENLVQDRPVALPAMDITADELVLNSRALGRLQLNAVNRPEGGWQMNRLVLDNPSGRLAGSGLWHGDARGTSETALDFDLDLRNAGGLLGVFGMPDTLRGGIGKLNGQLVWQGSPLAVDMPSLRGKLNLALGRGQFLRTEPGIAKLVGVLSLQSIPRRLSLDFSDVFEEGFAFDTIVGEARIADGVAATDSLLMNGVQAQVLVTGQADTFGETQNLSVQVRPTINAGLASIAYAAVANPAVGIGTLIAQMLLQKPLREMFGYEFKVQGTWSDPQVIQVKRPAGTEPANPVYSPG